VVRRERGALEYSVAEERKERRELTLSVSRLSDRKRLKEREKMRCMWADVLRWMSSWQSESGSSADV
jgi:cell division protein FtsL